eukprot:451426-Amphidinium_carterae.1
MHCERSFNLVACERKKPRKCKSDMRHPPRQFTIFACNIGSSLELLLLLLLFVPTIAVLQEVHRTECFCGLQWHEKKGCVVIASR